MPNLVPILILLAIAAAIFNAGFVATIVYLIALIALGARWWISSVQRHLRYRRRFDPRIFHGETARVAVELQNGSPLPVPWLVVRDRLPLKLGYPQPFVRVVAIPARGKSELAYDVRGSRRGRYPLGPLTLSFGDALGIEERAIRSTNPDFLVVYPRIIALARVQLQSSAPLGGVRSREPWNEDPARVVGVTTYRPGDSQRKINWAATARVGTLQVKQLEPAMTVDTVIVLDLYEATYELAMRDAGSELGITAAASLARRLVDLRQTVALLCNGLDPVADASYDPTDPEAVPASSSRPIWLPLGKGQGHLMRLLDVLARVALGSVIPLAELLRRHTLDLPWGATVVVVTADEHEGLAEALLGLRRRGYRISVLLVAARRSYQRRVTRMEALGFSVARAWNDDDLRIVFS